MSEEVQDRIKKLYHEYRHTEHIDKKGLFFSPTCLQICRPIPSYAATSREQIVHYLKDAQKGKVPSTTERTSTSSKKPEDGKSRSVYTIRPLSEHEFEFSSDEITSSIGMTAEEVKHKARAEKWVGMRVDLWDENPANDGLLVKVQYWWRLEKLPSGEVLVGSEEGTDWLQCCHDIMFLGPRDGTEAESGLELRE